MSLLPDSKSEIIRNLIANDGVRFKSQFYIDEGTKVTVVHINGSNCPKTLSRRFWLIEANKIEYRYDKLGFVILFAEEKQLRTGICGFIVDELDLKTL